MTAGCVDLRRRSTLAPSPLSILPPFQAGGEKEGKPGKTRTAESFAEGADTSIVLRLPVGIRTASVKNEALGSAELLEVEGHPPRVT